MLKNLAEQQLQQPSQNVQYLVDLEGQGKQQAGMIKTDTRNEATHRANRQQLLEKKVVERVGVFR